MFKGDRSRVNAAISITALAVNPERLHLPVFSDRGELPLRARRQVRVRRADRYIEGPMKIRLFFRSAALAAVFASCAPSHGSPPQQDAGAMSIMHITNDAHIAAGTESFVCKLVEMPADDRFIVKISHQYTPGSHHLIVLRTDYTAIPAGEDAPFECEELGMHVIGAMYGVQDPKGELELPSGVGLPTHAGEIALVQMHYLNPTGKDLDASVTLDVTFTSDATTIQQRAGMLGFYDPFIWAPAGKHAQATMRCPISKDITLLTATSHMHMRGTRFDAFVDPASGPPASAPFYTSLDWQTAALLAAPVKISAGSKLRFGCSYDNSSGDRDYFVGESAKDNEMCLFGGLYYPEMGSLTDFCVGADRLGSGTVSCTDTIACTKSCPSDQPNGKNDCMDKCIVSSCPAASAPVLAYRQCTLDSCAEECAKPGAPCDACAKAKCAAELASCSAAPCD